jgi:hypothetical protein
VLWPAGNKGPEIFYTTKAKNYNFSKEKIKNKKIEKERPRLACAYVAIWDTLSRLLPCRYYSFSWKMI